MLARSTCRRNEKTEVVFSLDTKKRAFAPLCRLTVEIRDMLDGTKRTERIFLSNNSKYTLSVPTEHCGGYSFKVTRGRAYDLLGLFGFPVRLPQECVVVVEPTALGPEVHPDFSGFQAKSFKPKAGGGFSEIHEIREYRPGDPLKNVHWKLSAKTDGLMIREPQEPESRLVLISVELTPDRIKLDEALDELRWVSEHLLEMEIPHNVCYLADGHRRTMAVNGEDDLHDIFRDIMSHPVRSGVSVMSGSGLPHADWRYHIDPHRKGDADEKK